MHSHRARDPALWGSEPTGDCRSPGNGLSPVETMRGKLRSGCRAAVDAGKGLRVPQEDDRPNLKRQKVTL